MVRHVRDAVSPLTGKPLKLSVLTGDNADSQQYNETRWFIDVLDGHRRIEPDSGVHKAVSGCTLPPGLEYSDNGSVYDGVRGGGGAGPDGGYYEPDGEGDGDGYTPDRARNQAEVPGPHADVTVRDFPGLFELSQQSFDAKGLGIPCTRPSATTTRSCRATARTPSSGHSARARRRSTRATTRSCAAA